MALFEKNEIGSSKVSSVLVKEVDVIVGNIVPGQNCYFVSDGGLSLDQVVVGILEKFGKMDMSLSTWTIKETQLQVIQRLKSTGQLGQCLGIFDHRIQDSNPKDFQFLTQIFDRFGLVKTHAKVTVLSNEILSFTILGSANWSKNPRLEAGVIDCRVEVGEFYKKIIEAKIIESERKRDGRGY
jgi:hypothetical protein